MFGFLACFPRNILVCFDRYLTLIIHLFSIFLKPNSVEIYRFIYIQVKISLLYLKNRKFECIQAGSSEVVCENDSKLKLIRHRAFGRTGHQLGILGEHTLRILRLRRLGGDVPLGVVLACLREIHLSSNAAACWARRGASSVAICHTALSETEE